MRADRTERTRALVASALVALCLTTIDCVPRLPEGEIDCESSGRCPDGWFCHADGRCRSTPEGLDADRPDDPDAAVLDSGAGDGGMPDVLVAPDVGSPLDMGPPTCSVDVDCSNGIFCDGAERCLPADPLADATGCVAPVDTTPCEAPLTCDEPSGRCLSACEVDDDGDGDGYRAVECGGDDCDDSNAARYPGRVEECDLVDNDCDPSTLGTTDADGDRAVSASCCNPDAVGGMTCGPDCNDGTASIGPMATEICNGADDDCDGADDEGVLVTFYRDGDRDGRGDSARTMQACTAPADHVAMGGDCADADPARFPGNPEVCDGVDNDCAGGVDNGLSCACTGTMIRACGTDTGVCVAGTQMCMTGAWSACTGSTGPTAETCNGMDDDCDGTNDDGATCAARSNTTAACMTSCTYTCVSGYATCDTTSPGDTTGCEANTRTDVAHCGGCSACATPSQVATRSCVSGACTVATCNAGFGDCDRTFANGCERDVRADVMNCGACGNACPARPSATPTCAASSCSFTCTSGFSNCDGNATNGCETPSGSCTLSPPRLLGPMLDMVVTSRRPVLRFALASGTTSARVQVCPDAACATVTWQGEGTSPITVGMDLPRGRYYWRAFGRAAPTVGTTPSAAWRFVTFAASTPATSTTGFSFLNVNGGAEDFAIGVPTTTGGTVQLYASAGSTVTQTLSAPSSSARGFGTAVAAAGDVNADGYGDLVVGACYADSADVSPASCGRLAYVYTGTSTGSFNTTPFATLASPLGTGGFGYAVSGAGDFNGDGYGDFVVGDYYSSRAYLYLGAASAASVVRRDLLPDGADPGDGMATGFYGISVASAGDVNGDGFTDVIVGRATGTNGHRAYVYLGNSGGTVTSEVDLVDAALAGTNAGISVSGAGDVNGDGLSDVILGGNAAGGVAAVFLGATAFTSPRSSAWMRLSTGSGSFGISVIGPGDVNGDGYSDIAVSRHTSMSSEHDVWLFLGGTTAPTMTTSRFWQLTSPSVSFGRWLGRAGLGADTLADTLVGACIAADGVTGMCTPTATVAVGAATMATPSTTTVSGTGNFGAGVLR